MDDEPIEQDAALSLDAGTPDGDGRTGSLPLAILAGILTAAAGVLVWTLLGRFAGREFVGISVVTGLAVGYVLRVVSGRSTIPVRIAAALILAVTCVAGTVTAGRAVLAKTLPEQVPGSHISWWELMRRFDYGQTVSTVRHRGGLTLAIYAAAAVIAFLSAGPQKPKPAPADPADPADAEPVATPESD